MAKGGADPLRTDGMFDQPPLTLSEKHFKYSMFVEGINDELEIFHDWNRNRSSWRILH